MIVFPKETLTLSIINAYHQPTRSFYIVHITITQSLLSIQDREDSLTTYVMN